MILNLKVVREFWLIYLQIQMKLWSLPLSDKDFWEEVYIAAIASGDNKYAKETADQALKDRNEKFPRLGVFVSKLNNEGKV